MSANIPLHQRILVEIEGRIVSGAWPPGYRIPFEVELARQYACSRMTVSRALTQLARRGLIERRRKSGSFVKQPVAHSAVLEIHDIQSEVQSLGLVYDYRLLSRVIRKASAADRQRLDVAAPAKILELTCCHLAGERPFCFEQRLISLATVPAAAAEPFSTIAPGRWLTEQLPWSAAEHTIRSIPADDRIAAVLRAPPGTACLAIDRRTWSNGAPVTSVSLIYLGTSHELVARFEPLRDGPKG